VRSFRTRSLVSTTTAFSASIYTGSQTTSVRRCHTVACLHNTLLRLRPAGPLLREILHVRAQLGGVVVPRGLQRAHLRRLLLGPRLGLGRQPPCCGQLAAQLGVRCTQRDTSVLQRGSRGLGLGAGGPLLGQGVAGGPQLGQHAAVGELERADAHGVLGRLGL
jgi:hypothetical protein